MGLLDRMGMKAEQKRLAPFFRPDEHFLETDVCDLAGVKFLDGSSGRTGQVALTLTNRAVYVRYIKGSNDTVMRIPYERIFDVISKHGLFEIITNSASLMFAEIGRPMGGDKYKTVVAGIDRIVNVREKVKVPGGVVLAIHRPTDEGREPEWMFQGTRGIDLSDDDVRAALEHALSFEFGRYGTPWTESSSTPEGPGDPLWPSDETTGE